MEEAERFRNRRTKLLLWHNQVWHEIIGVDTPKGISTLFCGIFPHYRHTFHTYHNLSHNSLHTTYQPLTFITQSLARQL